MEQNEVSTVDNLKVLTEHREKIRPLHFTRCESGACVEQTYSSEKMSSSWKVLAYALGILISYAVFGIYQEKILRSQYGEDKKHFTYHLSLLFVQCATNAIFAQVVLHTFWKQGDDLTEVRYYVVGSAFYLGAMLTSFTALKFVDYPTQVIAKSCKPISVMVLGMLLARKQYSLLKYVFVMLIIVGVSLFIYKDDHGKTEDSSLFGNLLLLISLTGDGLLGATQDRMRQEFHTKSLHMMAKINFIALAYVGIGLLYTGELPAFTSFVQTYPRLYSEIGLFTFCSAIGQVFIYSTVTEFGPLVCSIVTTTRKFFTVIVSVILFGNALNERQWFGTILVFAGLFLDSFYGKQCVASKKA
ncbi:solute carrier family 35 member B1-like [Tropilaelaps mercedesae]|uniref:Solute carrier family 35 member B1-like n=1 Tax=Tropilaelaps mercedesae TaxID=418985 RepID=A0A1V9XSR9_9ACAR|nr:solute carrier family 35 member B1-like [Tropilaelaps mercedesae]